MVWIAFNILGLAVVAGLGLAVLTLYNHLEEAKQEVEKAFASVEVLLSQRHAELPKLAELCRGNMEFEEVQARLAQVRARCEEGPLLAKLAAQNLFALLFGQSMLRMERYPALASTERFRQLQDRITDIESRIAARREYVNAAIAGYNTWISQWPQALLARAAGHRPLPLLSQP